VYQHGLYEVFNVQIYRFLGDLLTPTSYNEAETYRLFREDGRKEGREEGDARRLVNAVESLKGNMPCSLEKACQLLGCTIRDYSDAKKLINEVIPTAF
jgi:hypothetical protein